MYKSSKLILQGQERASFHRTDDRHGRCQYTFTVDSPVEPSCPSTMEAENLSARVMLLEAVVSRVLGAEAAPETARTPAEMEEIRQLLLDKGQLDRQVKELQRQVEELTIETEKLREKPCSLPPDSEDSFSTNRGSGPAVSGKFQEMKAEVSEVSVPPKVQENLKDNAGCGELVSVGEPETHQKANSITGKYGMWFQDPESPGAPYGPDTVWRIDTVSSEVRELYAYENLEQLARGYPTKVLLLPESMESTGATVYHGSLYYQHKQSPTLLRYDLAAENIVARRELPHPGFHGQYPYSWGGYTDIDLAVDEKGLWAIYSTEKARGAIIISQLDPENLRVIRSWETNIQKNKVANAFMVCGRLYTVASYRANNTTINLTFDTASGQSKAVDMPFRNRYGYNSMIDYNAARRKLYSWDNFHMVTYDVKLAKTSSSP
ncbi:myocilin-like isoform X2 [Tachysurus fulvidraco]|uniref:myocilin-like isoform X2 n=1 Tax=Tachysurus fulvidraco TaxID=1234273 RepID=UPI000F4D6C2D|nr:myocilin-like isoform X2 [Tachysurus fulvidraco]